MHLLRKIQPDVEVGRQLEKLKKHIDGLLATQGFFERLFHWWALSHWGNLFYHEVAEHQEGRLRHQVSKKTEYRLKDYCQNYAEFIHCASGDSVVEEDGSTTVLTYADKLCIYLHEQIEKSANNFKPVKRWIDDQNVMSGTSVIDYFIELFEKRFGSREQQEAAGQFFDIYDSWSKKLEIYLCPIFQSKTGEESVERTWVSTMTFTELQTRPLV